MINTPVAFLLPGYFYKAADKFFNTLEMTCRNSLNSLPVKQPI